MTETAIINCKGLSTALTALRIKQTLITAPKQTHTSLKISVSNICDQNQLKKSLGAQAYSLQFI